MHCLFTAACISVKELESQIFGRLKSIDDAQLRVSKQRRASNYISARFTYHPQCSI